MTKKRLTEGQKAVQRINEHLEALPKKCGNCFYFEDWRGTLFPPINLDEYDGRCEKCGLMEQNGRRIDSPPCELFRPFEGGQRVFDSDIFDGITYKI